MDTEAKVIVAIGPRTAEEILELRKIIAKMKGYTLEFGGEPGSVVFNSFCPPDDSGSGAQVKKGRIGYKQNEKG